MGERMQKVVEFDDRGFKRRFKDFESAHKLAARDTLNISAASTRKKAIKTIKSEFTLRNTWTTRNVAFEPVGNINKNKMKSVVGARHGADYLADQHEGGIRKHFKDNPEASGIWTPQRGASSGNSLEKPKLRRYRQKAVSKKLIRTSGGKHHGTRKSERVARMFMAKKLNKYYLGNHIIAQIDSIEKRKRNKIRVKSRVLYKIKKRTQIISPHKWLYPHAEYAGNKIPDIYVSRLEKLWKNVDVR